MRTSTDRPSARLAARLAGVLGAVLLLGLTAVSAGAAAPGVALAPARAQPAPDEPALEQLGWERRAPTARYSWPLWPRPAVLQPFQPPPHRYGRGHRGVDLAAGAGQEVLAAGDGVVVFAGPLAGRGVVSVQHADGLRTTYEPVTAAVRAGAVVQRGQLLGHLQAGHPTCGQAVCLHWGLRRGAEYLDPLRLVWGGQVRLLPWDGTGGLAGQPDGGRDGPAGSGGFE